MSKFVGKFRKNKNYNDDYIYDHKRHRNEHSESKKLIEQLILEDDEWEDEDYLVELAHFAK
jgi:hypothetical protein